MSLTFLFGGKVSFAEVYPDSARYLIIIYSAVFAPIGTKAAFLYTYGELNKKGGVIMKKQIIALCIVFVLVAVFVVPVFAAPLNSTEPAISASMLARWQRKTFTV